nr:3160_t:CDS:2 [Entrophospora candida]
MLKSKLKSGDIVRVITGKYQGTIDYISKIDPENQVVYLKKANKKKYDKLTPENKRKSELKEIMEIKGLVEKKFQHTSLMQVTDIEKIVLNSGIGQAVSNKQFLDNTEKALIQIAGRQKPILTYARNSITTFKLREGMLIGCISAKKFDQMGNYNVGIDDLNIFPTVPYDLTFKNQGLQITIAFLLKRKNSFVLICFMDNSQVSSNRYKKSA